MNIDPNNPIVKDLNQIVNFLGAAVGIFVVGTIIFGGIQYAMASDNSSAVSQAKQRILNGVIALVAFIFVFAFLQWLIPGGVFDVGGSSPTTPAASPPGTPPRPF
jgi:cytochrome bd-type quinol oxidase subunit 2